MYGFTEKELQLLIFLCMARQKEVGLDEAEKEGTGDVYRKLLIALNYATECY